MSFHDQFTANPEFPEWQEWESRTPILRDSCIRYVLHPWKCRIEDDDAASDLITVNSYCENGNGFGAYQENAWSFIVTNPSTIESELRRKLWPPCLGNYHYFIGEVDPNDEEWTRIRSVQNWEQPSALDGQVELTSIGLVDDGFDDVGFSLFEFAVGWDEEHGLSVLMHRGYVLAASCGADFTGRGPNLIPHAKSIQHSEFADGDLRIE